MNLINITFAKVYRYKQCTFEWHNYLGPLPLNRYTLEPRNVHSIGYRYWASIGKFNSLNKEEKEKFRVI